MKNSQILKESMRDHVSIIIEWKGPFYLQEIREDVECGDGIYIATGKLKNKQTEEIQYCGITEGSFYRRLLNHHKIHKINRNKRFWLGKIVYPQRVTRPFLELAESIIIYFWQPTLNERKHIEAPNPVTLINRWFKQDGTPRKRQHTLCKDLEDVLSWDGKYWRTGNLSVWEDE
jgi:hypothetical protein